MPNKGLPIADDVDLLRALVAEQQLQLEAERARRAAAEATVNAHGLLIEKLKIQIARLRRLSFGQSSEKLHGEIEQLELALEEMETAEATLPPKATLVSSPRQPADRSFPPHLRRQEIVHLPPGGDCVCPQCGGKLRRLGQDDDEMLDIEPVIVKVIRHVRPKFS